MSTAAPRGAVRARRVVLHRVSAAATRRQRAYHPCLPGFAEAAVRVRRAAPGSRRRLTRLEQPGRRRGCVLPRSHRDQAIELGRHAQLPARGHPQLLQAPGAQRSGPLAAVHAEYWRFRRRRRGSDRQPTSKPTTCAQSSPNPTGAPPTDGATTRCCCSSTTAALASARPRPCDGSDLQLVPPRQVRLRGKGKKGATSAVVARDGRCVASTARHGDEPATSSTSSSIATVSR